MRAFLYRSFRGRTIADYHVFIGVRFSVDIRREKSLCKTAVSEWKDAMVFAFPTKGQTFLGRYMLKDGRIYLNINIPLYTDEKHNLLTMPDFDEGRINESNTKRGIGINARFSIGSLVKTSHMDRFTPFLVSSSCFQSFL